MTPADPSTAGVTTLGVLLAIVDFPLLIAGYRSVIETAPDMRVDGIVGDRETLGDAAAHSTADVVVTDCLPDPGGSSVTPGGRCATPGAIEEIRAARPTVRILALECRCDTDRYAAAIRAGANGYLTREATPADVLAALRCVGRGDMYLSASVVARMVSTYVLQDSHEVPDRAFESLGERARDVFRLAAVGHSSREIARTLDLSEQAVRHQRATIMETIGAHGRVDLLRYALRHGIIRAGEL